MKKNDNMLWRFFASVKLALITLFILASTSIIGTLIPQKNPPAFYIKEFGPELGRLFQILDLADMYNSWWFVAILALFSINLIICTIDRLPNVWRMVVMDNLRQPIDTLAKMPFRSSFLITGEMATATATVKKIMTDGGWKAKADEKENSTLLFSQKQAWCRLGVYAVHLSILLIFAGAIIGTVAGYKGSIMIPEGGSTDKIYQYGTNKPIPLGFEVRCDSFKLTLYDSGMPKEYRSDLTVMDRSNNLSFSKSIIVNDPLDYRGITFYQASYDALQGLKVEIYNKKTGRQQGFEIPFGQKTSWPGTKVEFGIINMQQTRGMARLKVWFSDGSGNPETFWMDGDTTRTLVSPDGEYEFYASQLYATGLQVTKDPGVWTVYFGCILMLVGLYVAFFLSHRRIWVYINKEDGQCRVLVCGTSSKNKLGFEKDFSALSERFRQNDTIQTT
ncbi:MAG: cytochrome c biogenesis protein ResB [Desulfobulbaceae bacterium]|nr:cytochrome c biogenesis protein ResB [Desulfobulbaceae bacterium]HIJ78814.1 cytochrome c biogenesis protein ResB [Deltaproteobacteria bacterium]